MPDSSEAAVSAVEQPPLLSIPEMPDRLEAAGLKRVGAPRIRQLAATDPNFPAPVYERGRLRLWNWEAVHAYFSGRTLRQGERTDLRRQQEEPSGDSEQ
ncbi:hypothetical protein ABZ593_21125 [Streptomyces sp. NPDC012617]|uniref:hypothetical protein n=1 Tax=Streptomyces TaxID=1883 RepID=UPI00340C30EB